MTRLSAFWLGWLIFAGPQLRGQDHSDSSPDREKKHYLTFQLSYRGSAQRSASNAVGERQTTIDVNSRFSGRIEVRPEEVYDLPTSPEAQLKQAAAMQAAVLSGDVEKLKQVTPASLVAWYPVGDQVEITGTISETLTTTASQTEKGESRASSDRRTESYRGQKVFPGSFGNASVKIRAEEKKYDIQFMLMPDMAETMEAVHQTITTEHREEGNNQHKEEEASVPLDMGPSQLVLGYSNYQIAAEAKGMPFVGGSNELIGHTLIPIPKPSNWNGSWDIVLDVSWQIDVTLPPVELVLTADGYDQWRPETTLDRGAGKPLEVEATLKAGKDAKPRPRIEKFIWQLVGTSREPGVTLNYPLDQFTDDPDIELEAGGESFVLDKEKQKMERTVQDGWSDKVKVVPYDWGGWSTLQVTAVLADGRRVTGKLKGQPELGMRLPKRAPDSHIADVWKAEHKGGADNLDDENDPEGDGHPGDGFSLYEEYRGFVIQGEHVEGDPKAKDFFVLNLIGPDAEPGIELFASLSGFLVHTTTEQTEMSTADRLMNGNHTEGDRVVDQHGVWLKTFDTVEALGGTGAFTAPIDFAHGDKLSFRPKTTQGIGILKKGFAESDFSKPFNLRAEDMLGAYDRAIAHELLHSVGAIHHGTGDGTIEFKFVGPDISLNTAGRPYFAINDLRHPVELRDEAKHDLAAAVYPRYAKAYAEVYARFHDVMVGKPGEPGYPKGSEEDFRLWCDSDAGRAFTLSGMVGAEGGQHSGDQDCIMRYYFADFYPMKEPAEGYYQIAPGGERVGSILCRSTTGTGVNDSGHYPQSRHGNAKGGGNCAAQISPNDLVEARTTPF